MLVLTRPVGEDADPCPPLTAPTLGWGYLGVLEALLGDVLLGTPRSCIHDQSCRASSTIQDDGGLLQQDGDVTEQKYCPPFMKYRI